MRWRDLRRLYASFCLVLSNILVFALLTYRQVKRQFTLNARPDETYTIPVGGLGNNKELGISRGRYALKVTPFTISSHPIYIPPS